MKNMLLIFVAHYYKKAVTIIKVSLIIILMSFIAYTKPSSFPGGNEVISEQGKKDYKSSVSIVNGQYKIDSNVVETNRNKAVLVTDLKAAILIRKTTIEEIPDFMLSFLDSISINKKFDIVNSWEKWNTKDIMDLVMPNTNNGKENLTQLIDTRKELLPDKKLTYFAIGDSIALLSYHSGGIRSRQHIVIIKFQNERIVDFWHGTYFGLYINTRFDILQQLEGRVNGHGGC